MKTKNRGVKLILVMAMALSLAVVLPVQAKKFLTAKDMVDECKKRIKVISTLEAKDLHGAKGWVFLDVRTDKEYKRGSIPEAVHLDRCVLEFKIETKIPDKSANVVVFCKSGSRSSLSVCTLKQLGYINAVSMEGGWQGWIKAGYPIS